MAPANNKNQKSTPSAAPIDDDKWTEIVAKDEQDTTPDAPVESLPASRQQLSPPPASLHGPAPRQSPFQPWHDNRALSLQSILEARLYELAQLELGLLNTVDILERYLITNAEEIRAPCEIAISPTIPSPTVSVVSPMVWSLNRSNAYQSVMDMGHLIGLKRAIKLLEDALGDPDRLDVKCTIKQVTPPPPPPIPQPPFGPPMHSTSPYSHSSEKELRNVAKDIAKDAVREYKDGIVDPGREDVEKEMIKLIRDISLQALQKV